MRPQLTSIALAAVLATSGFTGTAMADSNVQVGVLQCTIAGGVGWVIGSSKSLECVFDPAVSGVPNEVYTGNISKFGIDIGVTQQTKVLWTVFSAKAPYAPGALAGSYGGASASATVGVGLGANVLVGGFEKSFALQPLSVQGQTGLDISAGIAELTLTAVQ